MQESGTGGLDNLSLSSHLPAAGRTQQTFQLHWHPGLTLGRKRLEASMWSYLFLLPIFLALWAIAGVWIVFAIAVVNGSVNLTHGFPYISICGSYPPQSCIFGQVLNMGAAVAAWICIVRYQQLRDWGVRTWLNKLTLWSGLICALGTSVVGNFQEKHQKPTHLVGAFFAFIVGNIYFWLQLLLSWQMKSRPQPGEPWIRPLRLSLCSLCSLLIVAMLLLHHWPLRSASAACEWALAMLLFTLFGLFAVDFSGLDGCTLCLRPGQSPEPQPAAPTAPQSPRAPRADLPRACGGSGPEPPGDPEMNHRGLSSRRDWAVEGLGCGSFLSRSLGDTRSRCEAGAPVPAGPRPCSEGPPGSERPRPASVPDQGYLLLFFVVAAGRIRDMDAGRITRNQNSFRESKSVQKVVGTGWGGPRKGSWGRHRDRGSCPDLLSHPNQLPSLPHPTRREIDQ